jgi:Fungal specific transcription factor domain
MPALDVPVEEQASCHFVSNFVLIPRQGSTRGFLEFLLPLLKTESPNPHFQQAFSACAMASLGNRANCYGNDIHDRALAEYSKALNSTHTALKDPEAAKSDATLATVLMLGLFEVRHT